MTTETNDTPPGWKLVPVEPTKEMTAACLRYARVEIDVPSMIWSAMLAASPEPPARHLPSREAIVAVLAAIEQAHFDDQLLPKLDCREIDALVATLLSLLRGDAGHNEGQPLIAERADPNEMVELLPCPFCGATSDLLLEAMTRASDDLSWWSVECTGCGVEVTDDESQEAANRHWNKRTPTTDREKLVRAVVERCAGLAKTGWVSADYDVVGVADADVCMKLCEHITSAIRSLNIDDLVKETGK